MIHSSWKLYNQALEHSVSSVQKTPADSVVNYNLCEMFFMEKRTIHNLDIQW